MSRRVAWWIVFLTTVAVYMTMLLGTLPAISAEAGGLLPLDVRLMGYTGDEVRRFLAELSDAGRGVYLGLQRKLDIVFPLLLGSTLAGLIQALVENRVLRIVLGAAVLFHVLADYTENYLVAGLLVHIGPVTDRAAATASWTTQVKYLSVSGVILYLSSALALAGWRRVRA